MSTFASRMLVIYVSKDCVSSVKECVHHMVVHRIKDVKTYV